MKLTLIKCQTWVNFHSYSSKAKYIRENISKVARRLKERKQVISQVWGTCLAWLIEQENGIEVMMLLDEVCYNWTL